MIVFNYFKLLENKNSLGLLKSGFFLKLNFKIQWGGGVVVPAGTLTPGLNTAFKHPLKKLF